MKRKTRITILALTLILALLLPMAVMAGDPFSNARADYVVSGNGVDGSWGHTVLNYVPGKNRWNVNGNIHGLLAETNYKVQIGCQGTPDPSA